MKKHEFRRKEEQSVHWFAFRNMKDKLYMSKFDISSAAQARVIRRQLIVPIVIWQLNKIITIVPFEYWSL
jgi:hypothetical protein